MNTGMLTAPNRCELWGLTVQILISQTTDSHFANYRFSFRKLQIFISQTTDSHFANYRFSFRFVPFRFAPFRFANYSKPVMGCSWILPFVSDAVVIAGSQEKETEK